MCLYRRFESGVFCSADDALSHCFLFFFFKGSGAPRDLPSSPTRRSSDLGTSRDQLTAPAGGRPTQARQPRRWRWRTSLGRPSSTTAASRSASHRQTASDSVDWRRDRKSTRLNSSHLVISYAVFCLKKKKK